jgi:hypothetical protein
MDNISTILGTITRNAFHNTEYGKHCPPIKDSLWNVIYSGKNDTDYSLNSLMALIKILDINISLDVLSNDIIKHMDITDIAHASYHNKNINFKLKNDFIYKKTTIIQNNHNIIKQIEAPKKFLLIFHLPTLQKICMLVICVLRLLVKMCAGTMKNKVMLL